MIKKNNCTLKTNANGIHSTAVANLNHNAAAGDYLPEGALKDYSMLLADGQVRNRSTDVVYRQNSNNSNYDNDIAERLLDVDAKETNV